MCDTISSTTALLFPHSAIGPPNPSFTRPVFIPTTLRTRGSQFTGSCFASNEAEATKPLNKSKTPLKTNRNSIPTGSAEHDFYGELGFKEKGKEQIEPFEKIGIGNGTRVSRGVDFIEFEEDSEGKRVKGENLVGTEEGFDGVGLKLEEMDTGTVAAVRKGRELMKRSNLIAKQVISIQSALSLGFVSQIWVDTVSWVVLVVEVRPNLLSGELERFFLDDVRQVGDVVLIQDECVMENELRMVGLETLVGYNVVTPGRQSIGKVRGYTFNINSGTVESLELDSLGISIIPSSLVSTYALLVEDVLEVVSDTVVVHEAAASRIHRLSKGLWDSQKLRNTIDQLGQHSDLERRPVQFDDDRNRRRSFTGRKLRPKRREVVDDWELPMDYL